MSNPFEIPETMRDFAMQSMEQARKAFDDYISAAQKAAEDMSGSGTATKDSVKRLQEETMAFAEANVTASFELAQRIVKARDPQEMVRIQQEYLQQQMAAFADQSRRLAEIAASATRAGKPR
jgi:phasin